jgi:hypothetical protein
MCYNVPMAKKRKKTGPKPKPPDQVRSVTLPAVRVTKTEIEELRAAAGTGSVSEEIRRRLFGQRDSQATDRIEGA